MMCETRDLGINWHALIFEGDRNIDMRYVCPKDVKKMLLQQARTVYWKKWAAKHEYEELMAGIWLEPSLALLRKKTKEDWTEKHRNVARKLVQDRGWVQQRLFDIGWSDEKSLPNMSQGGRHRKAQASITAQNGTRSNGRFQRLSESGSKKRELQRKSGSGKEVSSSTLSMKANGIEVTSV